MGRGVPHHLIVLLRVDGVRVADVTAHDVQHPRDVGRELTCDAEPFDGRQLTPLPKAYRQEKASIVSKTQRRLHWTPVKERLMLRAEHGSAEDLSRYTLEITSTGETHFVSLAHCFVLTGKTHQCRTAVQSGSECRLCSTRRTRRSCCRNVPQRVYSTGTTCADTPHTATQKHR